MLTGSLNYGAFRALLNFTVDADDSVLKENLEKGPKYALYVSPRIQNELISIHGVPLQDIILRMPLGVRRG